MKRFVFMVLALMLSGCTISKEVPYDVIENGSIHIAMPNQAYGNALETLWKKQYPQYANVLSFVSKTEHEADAFRYDIEWVSDIQAVKLQDKAQKFKRSGYQVPKALRRKELVGTFTPIQATGYLFAYDDVQLRKFGIDPDALSSFEGMAKEGRGAYYYQHTVEEMLPLWSHGIEEEVPTIKMPIDEEKLTEAVSRFQSLYQEMGFVDNPWISTDEIFQTYAFALVAPQQMKQSEGYQKGTLHFAKMPSYQKQSCAPYAQTYGFMASSTNEEKEIIQCFMDMVRSKQGIQAFLDTGEDVAVIDQEDLGDFSIFDARRKEMITAMNDSVLWNVSHIKEKPSIQMKALLQQEDMTSILQNGICAKKSASAIQAEMNKTLINWIKQQ